MTVANKPGHRGEHEGSRKTIARGMPGNPGVTVVTTLVCFLLCTRGCGRIRRPAFPAPSDFRGQDVPAKTRAKTRGEIAKLCRRTTLSKARLVCTQRHSSCPDLIRAPIESSQD